MRLILRAALALSVVLLGLSMVLDTTPHVRANLDHCTDPVPLFSEFGGGGGFCPAEYSTCEDRDGDGCIDIDMGGGGGDWQPPIEGECGTFLGFSTRGDYQIGDYGQCSSLPVCVAQRNQRNAIIPPASDIRFDCWASPSEPESSGRHLVMWRTISCGGSGAISEVGEWTVADGGDCLSLARCVQKRDAINVGPLPGDVRAYCWRSPRSPETTGTHLVLAEHHPAPTTTTTTSTTTTLPTPSTTTPRTTLPPTTSTLPTTTPPITIVVTLPPDTLPPATTMPPGDGPGDVIVQ